MNVKRDSTLAAFSFLTRTNLTVQQTDIQSERNLVLFVHIFSEIIVVYNLFFSLAVVTIFPAFLNRQMLNGKLRQQRREEILI